MSVAVAHQVSPTGKPALTWGAKEAALRSTRLAIIHVVPALDLDSTEANRAGISDAVERVLTTAGLPDVQWDLHLVAGGTDIGEVTAAILDQVRVIGPDLLVIGARRRSPVGKAFLGSVTQDVLLRAEVPVLVVKSPL